MSSDAARELLQIQEELDQRRKYNFIQSIFPDKDIPDSAEQTGFIHSRFKYPKHLEFLNAGGKASERAFIAANRVGKSLAGCYELACHLTGWYPDWWTGKRFNKAITAWVCGDRAEAVRDGVQKALLERSNKFKGEIGTGLLPKASIKDLKGGSNIPGFYGLYEIYSANGGISTLTVKTYSSGRTAFESAAIDVIMLDEECPRDIYSECLLRTMTTKGIVYLTFTPDSGLTDTVLAFFENGDFKQGAANGKFVTMVGWDDVPHITESAKAIMLSALQPHEIDCRSKGLPFLGSGVIFPFSPEQITVEPFKIPDHWLRCYGLDVGWNKTACMWLAIDPDTRTRYLYSEYYAGQAEPSTHAHAVRSRGHWISGVVDPAARGRSQIDGRQLIDMYNDLGLDLTKADNSVEAGIYQMFQMFSAGTLKVFSTCQYFLREFRLYRRAENGQIIKKDDHLIDAARYVIMSGEDVASLPPIDEQEYQPREHGINSSICGY